MPQSTWFQLHSPEQIDSPALLVFADRVKKNIDLLIEVSPDIQRLRPHVKTHKMAQVADLHLQRGIKKFKCATISEAEMLAQCGAESVLLAYQPVGPKLNRLVQLAKAYPQVSFGALVDDELVLQKISDMCVAENVELHIWIDLNNGMGRTGIVPGEEADYLYECITQLPGIQIGGIHAYDGQFRQSEFANRKQHCDHAFQSVIDFQQRMTQKGIAVPNIIAGGSPTFPVHSLRDQVDLSPGTYVFWDAGYGEKCKELPFIPAALIMTRIISKPGGNRVCLDLGHKGIAAENPIENRVRFLNAEVDAFVGQSEEHLIVEVEDISQHTVGDIWYGIPWHICPTVALYQEANIVEQGKIIDQWPVVARDRRIQY